MSFFFAIYPSHKQKGVATAMLSRYLEHSGHIAKIACRRQRMENSASNNTI